MSKVELTQNYIALRTRAEDIEKQITAQQAIEKQSSSRVTTGGLALLVFSILVFVLPPGGAILCGLLALAGLLTMLTAMGKRSSAQTQIRELQAQLSQVIADRNQAEVSMLAES